VWDGVIVATLGYWRSLNRSDRSVNSISSAEFCGLGRAPTFSDNLVQVVRVNWRSKWASARGQIFYTARVKKGCWVRFKS